MAQAHVLLLNADFRPLKVITWQRAITMLLDEKVELVTGYVGDIIRTVSTEWVRPAVVRLLEFHQLRGRLRFSRQNVLARDSYTCGYCGSRPVKNGGPDIENLTIDHVVPKSRGVNGKVKLPWDGRQVSITCWDNVITACSDCNFKKAARTPREAGMPLRIFPRIPTAADSLRMTITKVKLPEEWKEWLPSGSGWGGYWTDELDPG
jgi:5-methylcytosine-specific restriction endonuclease McrA